MTAERTNARCATTGWARAWSLPAPRPARPSPSSSGRWTSSANGPRCGYRTCAPPGRTTPSSTWTTRTTASVAAGRSSCCWTSPRCTACRRIRWSPPATWPASGSTSAWPRPAWPPPASRSASAGGSEAPMTPERRGKRRRAEQLMVPDAEFTSYYGRPVIKEPAWGVPDVPGYLFLGGLAGASSVLAASAELSGYDELARVAKVGALGAISLSAVALVHDLGRPERFLNMLRVLKPSSPMSVGSWLLAVYAPASAAASVNAVTG